MARKTHTFTIESGRDKGKTFLITEMPLLRADRWAMKMAKALAAAGIDMNQLAGGVDMQMNGLGMLGIAQACASAIGNMEEGVFEELTDTLLGCAEIVVSNSVTRPIIYSDTGDSDIEDIGTVFKIRAQAFKLHVDFLTDGAIQ